MVSFNAYILESKSKQIEYIIVKGDGVWQWREHVYLTLVFNWKAGFSNDTEKARAAQQQPYCTYTRPKNKSKEESCVCY